MEFDLKNKQELAKQKHLSKYNCAQAVACSFAAETGFSESELYRIAEGFGGGMATGQNGCGALMGACIVLGILNSDGDILHPGTSKPDTMDKAAELSNRFRAEAGSIICGEIKGGKRISCPDCVALAISCLQDLI